MIFVTVGTHEQQFNRLIQAVDELVRDKVIIDEVFMQIGYSTYEPKYTKWAKVISYEEMERYEDKAEIIITHGGPATFMNILNKGKVPIVVPRLEKFSEHVNNHQLEFARKIKELNYNIVLLEDLSDLGNILREEKNIIYSNNSNNKNFVENFEKQINSLVKVRKKW
ncbi:MAG: hypothetical protein FWF59_11035 [Turicibacter sp.]|nr:hypothetical protein [Turicibacter sp.]